MTPRRAGRRRPHARRRLQFVAPLLSVALLSVTLSACLTSGYRYFSHRNPDKTDMYFKVPSTWTTFTDSQLIQAVNGKLSTAQINQIAGAQWLVAFSGRRGAGAKQAGTIGNQYPGGYTFAQQLSATARDGLSFSAMRAEILGTDPLTAGGSDFNVLSYNEFNKPGGIRGSKMVVDIGAQNSPVLTYGQVVEVDPQTNWIFAIGIGCRASCWGPNQGVINQILSTWQVKEEG